MPWNNDYTPRPTAQVYQLRRDGEIDQAYQLARRLHQRDLNDDDASKAYAWTLIDLCKRYIANNDLQSARPYSDELSSLEFSDPDDDFIQTIIKQAKSIREKLNPFAGEVKRASELSKNGNIDEAMQIMTGLKNAVNMTTDRMRHSGGFSSAIFVIKWRVSPLFNSVVGCLITFN